MIVDIGSQTYRLTKLDARAQYALLSRLSPVLPALDGVGRVAGRRGQMSMAAAIDAVAPLANIEEDDLDFILDACMATCEVETEGVWHPASERADDLDLSASMQVVAHVVALNFAPFFSRARAQFQESWDRHPRFQPVSMPNGLDWLLRPVLRGLCRYESLIDGTLHIEDIAEMNDLLNVADENQSRAQAAAEKERQ